MIIQYICSVLIYTLIIKNFPPACHTDLLIHSSQQTQHQRCVSSSLHLLQQLHYVELLPSRPNHTTIIMKINNIPNLSMWNCIIGDTLALLLHAFLFLVTAQHRLAAPQCSWMCCVSTCMMCNGMIYRAISYLL